MHVTGGGDGGGNGVVSSIGELSALSTQFCCEPKIALKNEVYDYYF